jgi:putative salt-induced outer membrane protein
MRRSLLVVLFCALCASVALADQVTLKNGDRLTGTIVSADGKTLQLKTDFGGDINIDWKTVAGIESSQDLTLTTKDGKKSTGKVSMSSDGKFVVNGGAPIAFDDVTAVRDPAEQQAFDVATEKMEHPKITYFWGGIADGGLALTRGNSNTISFTFDAKAVRATPRDKLTVYANYILANNQTTIPYTTTANLFQGGIRGDLNLSPRVFVYATADYTTNQLQNLQLRQVYGGGIGYHVIKNDTTLFDVFGGADYDRDQFSAYTIANPAPPPPLLSVPSSTLNSAEINVGEQFNKNFTKRTALNEIFVIFPNLSHTGDYRFTFNASFALAMKNWLSWQTTFQDLYISYPPPGLKGNDLVLSTGIRVLWGAKLQ